MTQTTPTSVAARPGQSLTLGISRVIGILLVIIGHSYYVKMSTYAGMVDYSKEYNNSSFGSTIANKIVGYIYLFHMPLFVFISGCALAFSVSNKPMPKGVDFILSKARRLLIPYLIAAALWVIPLKTLCGFYQVNVLPAVVSEGFILGLGSGHLWFLMMLWVLFVFVAISGNWWREYRLSIPVAIALYLASDLVKFDVWNFSSALHHSVFFLLGACAVDSGMFKLTWRPVPRTLFAAGAIVLYLILVNYFLGPTTQWTGSYGTIRRGVLLLLVSVSGIAAVMTISSCLASVIGGWWNRVQSDLDQKSMLLYIIHDPLNYVFLSLASSAGMLTYFSGQSTFGALTFFCVRFGVVFVGALAIVNLFLWGQRRYAKLSEDSSQTR